MNQPEIVREWWQVETKNRKELDYYLTGGSHPSRNAAQHYLEFVLSPSQRRHARIAHHIETKTIL